MNLEIFEWLLKRPVALLIVGVVAVIALVVWFNSPITWRDGEGSVISDDGEPIGRWALKRYFRIPFTWW